MHLETSICLCIYLFLYKTMTLRSYQQQSCYTHRYYYILSYNTY
uniref:Uncharacterized protein n=1 Tax=Geladintestivirus 1 TaxID=3233133 RepID=A0AAU8MKQ5_9CAUD